SIDWCCFPKFDSPSIFAKIIDNSNGGFFKVDTVGNYNISQEYLKNTCILKTAFNNGFDEFHIIDYMPRYQTKKKSYYSPPEITRIIKYIKGNPKIRIIYDPRLDYSIGKTRSYDKSNFIVSISENENYETLYLYSNASLNAIINNEVIELESDLFFKISYYEKLISPKFKEISLEFNKTKKYWINWINKTPKFKKYNNEILRSALTLKLLTYQKTGAVLAAVTTSLPETIGEERNWDYRFCWIRDASMVIKVVAKLGHKNIVKNFIKFIINVIPDKNEKLQIMYGINGEKILEEKTLDHFSGYLDSTPVRIGNAAYNQKQNDIYGILMDAIHYHIEKFPAENQEYEELWSIVKSIVWIVKNNWKSPDKGIWEFRNEDKHFTFSKLLSWVAIDRAIKISILINKSSNIKKWKLIRKEIYNDILKNGWNKKIGAFTQSYGSDSLDASLLLMESFEFMKPNNLKYVKTVKAIEKDLMNDGLLFRYKNEDDFGFPSSSFTVCSFWYINSLYKIGEKEKSKNYFEKILKYSNHLGLYSEDLDFKSKRLLGNFPQAYSHLALIDCALNFNSK
ncbi:glycoside hydrolase family 15 protein, partial [Flavobacteriaceae bacterium]|nr:glycoside hydrolase family 15 protein [Flavobacteriaceae bacterium]